MGDTPDIRYRGSIEKQGFEAADAAADRAANDGGAFPDIGAAIDAESQGYRATRSVMTAHQHALASGLRFHDAPAATGTDYSGYTHRQLHAFVNQKLSPEQLNEIGYGWNQDGNNQIDIARDITDGVRQVDAEWQGDAADGAKGFLSDLATWFEDSGRGMALTGDRINAMRDSAEWARQNMPEPQDFTAKDAGDMALNADVMGIGGVGGAVDKAVGDSRAAHVEAVRVMHGYAGSMTDHSSQVPAYPTPPGFDPSAGKDDSSGGATTPPPTRHGRSHTPPPSVPGLPQEDQQQSTAEQQPTQHRSVMRPPDVPGDANTATTTASASPSPTTAAPQPNTGTGSGTAPHAPGSEAGNVGGAYGNVRNRLGGSAPGRGGVGQEPHGRHAAGRARQAAEPEPRGGRRAGAHRAPSETAEPRTTAERAAAGRRGRNGMPMTGGRGGKQGEDKEHKNKYVKVDGQETFGDDRKVAPEVIGELPEDQAKRRRKPDGPGTPR